MPAYYSATVTAHMSFGDHVEYIIQVVQEGSTWNVRHRYSEFHTLHSNLLRDYNTKAMLPPKQWLTRLISLSSRDDEFLNSRLRGLNQFLQEIISCEQESESPDLGDFLKLRPRKGLRSQSDPVLLQEEQHAEGLAEWPGRATAPNGGGMEEETRLLGLVKAAEASFMEALRPPQMGATARASVLSTLANEQQLHLQQGAGAAPIAMPVPAKRVMEAQDLAELLSAEPLAANLSVIERCSAELGLALDRLARPPDAPSSMMVMRLQADEQVA